MKEQEGLMAELDKTGTHLKYFSQKQDVVPVKNLMSNVQHRWETVAMRLAERARHLDRADREARQFRDAWNAFDGWLNTSEQLLDAESAVQVSTVDPDAIRAQIISPQRLPQKPKRHPRADRHHNPPQSIRIDPLREARREIPARHRPGHHNKPRQ